MSIYTDRITPAHVKPKFVATVDAITAPVAAVLDMIAHLPMDFDLDDAVGVQLDQVGEWVGRSRTVLVPIVRQWFSLDVAGKGLDESEWVQSVPEEANAIDLDDETYRRLLKAKIASNEWDGTAEEAARILKLFFGEAASLFVEDRQDMSCRFCFAGNLPPPLYLVLFARGYLPMKAGGVRTEFLVTSVPGAPIFGFDVSNGLIAGFDQGAVGISPELLIA